jgi:hypothetical protein
MIYGLSLYFNVLYFTFTSYILRILPKKVKSFTVICNFINICTKNLEILDIYTYNTFSNSNGNIIGNSITYSSKGFK